MLEAAYGVSQPRSSADSEMADTPLLLRCGAHTSSAHYTKCLSISSSIASTRFLKKHRSEGYNLTCMRMHEALESNTS